MSNVTVDIDLDGFNELLGPAAMEAAQDAMSRRWRDLVEPHVPMEYGPLRENVEVDGQDITYSEEYAAYVYNMDGDTNWTTPGTSAFWDEAAKAESGDDLTEYVARVLTGGAE